MYYLKSGYTVLGIEPHPESAKWLDEQFWPAMKHGQYAVDDVFISNKSAEFIPEDLGERLFFCIATNPEASHILTMEEVWKKDAYRQQKMNLGTQCKYIQEIDRTFTCFDIFTARGLPRLYANIDIEGEEIG